MVEVDGTANIEFVVERLAEAAKVRDVPVREVFVARRVEIVSAWRRKSLILAAVVSVAAGTMVAAVAV